MFQSRYILILLLVSNAFGGEKGNLLYLPEDQINITLRQTAMPELKQNKIGKILTRYYKEGLGGPESWEKIESLNIAGKLKLKNGESQINAYQKKPNLIKMSIRRSQSSDRMVLAYDGKAAWKQTAIRARPEVMDKAETRRFIHSSHFGNYLLYPFANGKTIRYIDTVPIEGTICHKIRVTLGTEYQVDYYIDIRSYMEIKVENTDLRNGKKNSLVYKDYVVESGMPIAKKVDSYEQGEWISTLVLDEVKINSGIMPWMFNMPK